MAKKHWVGLDVGTRRTRMCIVDEQSVIDERDLDTDPQQIEAILHGYESIEAVGLETGAGLHLTRCLRSAGFRVMVFDAFKASHYLKIRRNKSDANDARGIAEIARLSPSAVGEVQVRSVESQSIRSRLKLRKGIISQRIAAENMLRGLLRQHGRLIGSVSSSSQLRVKVDEIISQLRLDGLPIELADALSGLLDFCISTRAYGDRLTKELTQVARRNPICKQLMTVPGVGPLCALSFFSAIEDPVRFRRTADVGAYLGLTPRVKETGGRSSRARISKAGDRLARANLYVAARVLMSNGQIDCAIGEWATQLKERVGPTRARVAVARKLSVILATMWKSGAAFEPYPTTQLAAVPDSVIRTEGQTSL